MYPTIEDIRKIAAKGQYKRVPVCREVYADRYTPVEAMRTLRKASRLDHRNINQDQSVIILHLNT